MKKYNYNIEFAHIYADKKFGKEQIKSVQILEKLIKKLKKQNKTFVTSLLIDDLHINKNILNEKEFLKSIKEQGIQIDFIGYESKFSNVAKQLIKEIPRNKKNLLKNGNIVYCGKIGLTNNGNYTCALLAASWYLCRLGVFKVPKKAIKKMSNKPFKAEKIITILPKKYKPVEKKAIDIIKSTKFKDKVLDIEYVWF